MLLLTEVGWYLYESPHRLALLSKNKVTQHWWGCFQPPKEFLGKYCSLLTLSWIFLFWHSSPLPFFIHQGAESAPVFRCFPSIIITSNIIQRENQQNWASHKIWDYARQENKSQATLMTSYRDRLIQGGQNKGGLHFRWDPFLRWLSWRVTVPFIRDQGNIQFNPEHTWLFPPQKWQGGFWVTTAWAAWMTGGDGYYNNWHKQLSGPVSTICIPFLRESLLFSKLQKAKASFWGRKSTWARDVADC